jgi:hypothetical protein
MKTVSVSLVLCSAMLSMPAVAQGAGGGFMRDQNRVEAQQRADMMFQMIDSNGDGVVTRAEAEGAAAQFQGRGSASGRGGGRIQRMLDQAFAASQSLTRQQFEALALARFDAQDLNHDGVVSAAERQQTREQRMQGHQSMVPPAPAAPVPPPRQPRQ